jgi:hypothetical protein
MIARPISQGANAMAPNAMTQAHASMSLGPNAMAQAWHGTN